MMVRYGDLDLSTKQGVDLLHQRIRAAAKHVCGDGSQPGDLARVAAYHRCVRTAADKALAKGAGCSCHRSNGWSNEGRA